MSYSSSTSDRAWGLSGLRTDEEQVRTSPGFWLEHLVVPFP